MPWIWFAGTYHVLHQILLVPYFSTIFDFVMFHYREVWFLTFLAWWLCARLLRRSCFQMWWREGLRGCPFLQSQPQRTSCRHLHRSERSGQEFQPSGDFSIRYGHQILFCLLFHISVVSFSKQTDTRDCLFFCICQSLLKRLVEVNGRGP